MFVLIVYVQLICAGNTTMLPVHVCHTLVMIDFSHGKQAWRQKSKEKNCSSAKVWKIYFNY